MEAGYALNAAGEKVLPGSRRPDGTLRKERRIRAGYTPQDEQPAYQSGGVLARQNVPKCPGLDPADASPSGAAKSKAAKKNEKRKASKKAEGGLPAAAASPSSAPLSTSVARQPQQQQQQQLQQQQQQQQQETQAQPRQGQPQAVQADVADSCHASAALDKQIKAVSKKLRQCEALVVRQAGGESLTAQEQEKVSKMAGWQEDVRQLEHQLAKLVASG